MFTLQIMWLWVTAQAHETSQKYAQSERGASAVELVIIFGGMAMIALAAIGIVKSKVLSKVGDISLN